MGRSEGGLRSGLCRHPRQLRGGNLNAGSGLSEERRTPQLTPPHTLRTSWFHEQQASQDAKYTGAPLHTPPSRLFDKENKQKGVSEYYYYLVNNYRKVVTMEPQREGKRGTGRVSAREWRGEVSLLGISLKGTLERREEWLLYAISS
jgi:hypothetical protein